MSPIMTLFQQSFCIKTVYSDTILDFMGVSSQDRGVYIYITLDI